MSTKTGHTPGPWQWTDELENFQPLGDHPELRGPNGESIITCGEYRIHNKVEDARLIALAPELLEALRDMLDLTVNRKGGQWTEGEIAITIKNAQQLLVKAEGRRDL